jgi:CopG family transcriptional regulator, nickel-responsive regulator
MTIISVSLNDVILKEIQKIQKEQGYSGRSEVIRAGIRNLISESKETDKLTGDINSILILIHKHEAEDAVSGIKHDFKDITKTQIHSHLEKIKCLEIFVLQGKSERIKEMYRLFKTNKKMDIVKLIIP